MKNKKDLISKKNNKRKELLLKKQEKNNKKVILFNENGINEEVKEFIEEKADASTVRTVNRLSEQENLIQEAIENLDNNIITMFATEENPINKIEYDTNINVEEKIKKIRNVAKESLEKELAEIRNKKENIITKKISSYESKKGEFGTEYVYNRKELLKELQNITNEAKGTKLTIEKLKDIKRRAADKKREINELDENFKSKIEKVESQSKKDVKAKSKEFTIIELTKESKIRFDQYKKEYDVVLSEVEQKAKTPRQLKLDAERKKRELIKELNAFEESLEDKYDAIIREENKKHKDDKNYRRKIVTFKKDLLDKLDEQKMDERLLDGKDSSFLYLDEMKEAKITSQKEAFKKECIRKKQLEFQEFYKANYETRMNDINSEINKNQDILKSLENTQKNALEEFNSNVDKLKEDISKRAKANDVKVKNVDKLNEKDLEKLEKKAESKISRFISENKTLNKIKNKLAERKTKKEEKKKIRLQTELEKDFESSKFGIEDVIAATSMKDILASQVRDMNLIEYSEDKQTSEKEFDAINI